MADGDGGRRFAACTVTRARRACSKGSTRAGRPIRAKTYGKKREHGRHSYDFGPEEAVLFRRPHQRPVLLRAIMAHNLACTQHLLLGRRIARNKPGANAGG